MKVAICYWGLTRAVKHVYQSHQKNIYDVLKENGIEYTIFMHTWRAKETYTWEHKNAQASDDDEYKLINPDYYYCDDQDEFRASAEFSTYLNGINLEGVWSYEDHTGKKQIPVLSNVICALESKKRLTHKCIESGIPFDFVLYIRPDVIIHAPLNHHVFTYMKEDDIAFTPHFNWGGFADRFAITTPNTCLLYGTMLDKMIETAILGNKVLKYEAFVEYSKPTYNEIYLRNGEIEKTVDHGKSHIFPCIMGTEIFLKYNIYKHCTGDVYMIDFPFHIVRSDGEVQHH